MDVGIRIGAVDATQAAFDTVGANLRALQGSAAGVSAALSSIGVGLTVGGFIAFTKSAIDSLDALNDLKDATGASIENISALEDIARRTGTSFDTVGTALTKLNKALTSAKPDSDTAKAITAIGLSIKDLKNIDPAEAFQKIAVGLSQFADDGNKARLTQELFGKSLKEVAPLLKDVAEKGELVATVTTAQAEEAEKFNKQIFEMQKNLLDLSRSLVGPLITGMNALIDKFKEGSRAGDGFLVTLLKQTEISRLIGKLPGFEGTVKNAGLAALTGSTRIGGTDLSAYAQRQGFGSKPTVGDVLADTSGSKAALDANLALINTVRAGAAALKAEAEAAQGLTTVQKEIAKLYEEISTSKNKYTLATLLAVDAVMQEKLASERSILDKKELAEQNKLMAELAGLTGSFAQDWDRLSAVFKAGKLSLEGLVSAQADLLAKQPAIKAAAEAQAKVEKDIAKAWDDAVGAQERYNAGFQQSAQRVIDQVQALQDEAQALQISAASHITLAQAIEQVAIARLNVKMAAEARDYNFDSVAAIQTEIEARKELATLIDSKTAREAAKDAAKDAAAEWKRAAEQIETSITDALMRGFESGKGFAENFRDTVVNMFKSMVLRPVIQATVGAGLSGLGLSANAASNLSGGSGLLSGASLLNSAGSFGGLFASNAAYGAAIGTTSIGAGSQAAMLAAQTGEFGAAGLAATSSAAAGAGGGFAAALGAIPGWGWAALGVGALLGLMGGDKNKQQNTGNATSRFDASGTLVGQETFFGGSSDSADRVINGLQSAYAKAAAALSIGTVATAFNFGSNVRKDGSDARFALGGYAGASAFQQTETASSDAAIQLAASRAVFAALKGSELPGYLAGVFNSLNPAGASQDQISAALAFAGTLKQVRDALSETRTPLQILQDDLTAGTAALSTSAATFKTDFIAAIDGGITPELLTQWQALGSTMDQLAAASGKADEAITTVARSLADIANERASLQDQLDELTLTSAQLRAKERATIDASNLSLYDQVQAQQDLQTAAAAAADAATAAADALAAAAETLRASNATRLADATAGASSAFAALQRAVAAEQASNTAAYEAQRAIATAAYTSQQTTMQASIDGTRDSLNAVADSVGRIKSLSGSLKSALDGMRIAGSEGSSRASAQAEISAALARARAGGGLPLDGQLSNALATVARPSEQLFESFADYAKDFYRTAHDIASLSALSDAQLGGAQSAQATLQDQLAALEDQRKVLKDGFDDQVDSLSDILTNAQRQLDAANGINTSVLSVADAIAQLNDSISTLSGVRASQGQATTPGVAEGRLDTIRTYMQGLKADNSLTDIQKASVLAAAARSNGVSEAEITAAWGGSAAITRQFFQNAGIAQFAVGTNYVPRDMLAQIHEGEAIIPRAYNPAAGGSNNAALIAELRALRQDVAALQASSERGNIEAKRAADAVNGRQGTPMLVEIAA